MNRMKLVAASLTCVLALGFFAVRSQAYSTYAKWGSNSVVVYANPTNNDVDSTSAETALNVAMNDWNTQGGTPFRWVYGGRVNDTSTGYDGRNVIIFRNTSNGSAIATTYSWWSGSTLVDADIIVWDGAYQFFTGTSGCSSGAYIEDVVTHELGHALGLNHSSDPAATMYPSYNWCSTDLRSLGTDDIAGVQSLYGTSTTATNTAPTVTISSPTTTSFAQGSTISFAGSASDKQDGSLTSRIVWTSSLVGQIGVGGSFSTTLTAGTHVITASVTDSGGLTSSAQITITVAAATTNTAPAVTISSPTTTSFTAGTSISFAGSASDTQDGNITTKLVWTSSLVGQIGTGGSFGTTLTAGTHVITASVTDSGGLTSTQQITLTIAAATTSTTQPTLAASGYKIKKNERVDLTWSGFSVSSVDVYRNGKRVTSTTNDGVYTDSVRGSGTFDYKLCAAGTSVCSNDAQVTF